MTRLYRNSRCRRGAVQFACSCFVLLSILGGSLGCASSEPVFNGVDLAGWEPVVGSHTDANSWTAAGAVVMDPAHEEKLFRIEPGEGILVNGPTGRTSNLRTVKEYGDIDLHVEFLCPRDANSGVYLMGMYELQIRERSHKDVPKLQMRDCGGIFARVVDGGYVDGYPPLAKAMRGPGEWQTFDIRFRAPRFAADGAKIENARFEEVRLNGQVVQKDVEMRGPTGGHLPQEESAKGPVLLQGNHGAVAFRNLRVRER